MADLQRISVEAVTGPSDSSVQQYIQKNITGSGDFCVDQKIRSTAYTNFSVLGLIITLALSGSFIIVSEIIEPSCAFFRRRYKRHAYKRLEWVTNETLQLQRMVYEGLGLGTWSGASSKIPITKKDEKLGILDISDEEHPIVIRPIIIRPAYDQGSENQDSGSQTTANAASNPVDDTSNSSQNVTASSDSETNPEMVDPEAQADGGEVMQSAPHFPPGSPSLDPEPELIQGGKTPTSIHPSLGGGNDLHGPSRSSPSPSSTP